jgi:hypothetical protein
MLRYGVTEIQSKPSLIKGMSIGEIVDKRRHITLGYFISAKYESYIRPVLEQIDREEKRAKLKRLKAHDDLTFTELGVDDGL